MIAGGIYILIFVVKSSLGSVSAPGGTQNSDGKEGGLSKEDAEKLAIVPIGTPFLAGPGSITAAMILNGDPSGVTTTIIAIIVNVLLTYLPVQWDQRSLQDSFRLTPAPLPREPTVTTYSKWQLIWLRYY
jgi:small neutral amino acid transporter SnatA (MarC family)